MQWSHSYLLQLQFIVHIKNNETSRPIKMFHLNKRYCNHHINVIIWLGLNEMLVCYHPTLTSKLRFASWREALCAWLFHGWSGYYVF